MVPKFETSIIQYNGHNTLVVKREGIAVVYYHNNLILRDAKWEIDYAYKMGYADGVSDTEDSFSVAEDGFSEEYVRGYRAACKDYNVSFDKIYENCKGDVS